MQIASFNPDTRDSGADHGERVSPRDLVAAPLIISVREVREVKTKFSPEGKDAVALDLVGVSTGKVARDQLWFNGALVDALRPYVGQAVPCKLGWAQSASSGYSYLVVEALDNDEQKQVDAFLAETPDPFAAESPAVATAAEGGASAGVPTTARW